MRRRNFIHSAVAALAAIPLGAMASLLPKPEVPVKLTSIKQLQTSTTPYPTVRGTVYFVPIDDEGHTGTPVDLGSVTDFGLNRSVETMERLSQDESLLVTRKLEGNVKFTIPDEEIPEQLWRELR